MMPRRWTTAILLALGSASGGTAAAQDSTATRDSTAAPAAAPADVSTIDSIIPVLYRTISGPVGAPREWDRMRSLFHPEARLIPSGCTPQGVCGARVLTVEGYIGRADSALRAMGFHEREIARRTERFGNVAHVFSTYESYRGDETSPFSRGINSIQLLWDGRRWWIMNVFWDSEREGNPIPEKYVK